MDTTPPHRTDVHSGSDGHSARCRLCGWEGRSWPRADYAQTDGDEHEIQAAGEAGR